MAFYLIAVFLVVIRLYQIYLQHLKSGITYPSFTHYFSLIKDVVVSKDKQQTQELMMQFIADLGVQSLEKNGSGIAYFRLPNLAPVYVLSNKKAIQSLYSKGNELKFSQKPFFTRLSVILGKDNLMSSDLGSSSHSKVRRAILKRNESFRPHVLNVVQQFFKEYELQQRFLQLPLNQLMDKLSRRVLLATYFGDGIIEPFEHLYDPSLTKELINCLFSLESISDKDKVTLQELREKIVTLGCKLIFSTKDNAVNLMQKESWLNYLLEVRVLQNEELKNQCEQLGISTANLSPVDCEHLIKYAIEQKNHNLLSATVIDAINESLFIPLLGFDATASVLITALRIAIQNKRIYSIIKHEILNHTLGDFTLKSTWDYSPLYDKLSYTEAVVLEALRLTPPAPIVPEIANQNIVLKVDGTLITIPEGAFIFMPLQGLHTHPTYFPQITLSETGQKAIGKPYITSQDVFPERWKPKNSQGVHYNADFFVDEQPDVQPGNLDSEHGLLTFKAGARRCPGLRIALTEVLSLLVMLQPYKFKLTNEEQLDLNIHYDAPLQRNGGVGLVEITTRKPVSKPQAVGREGSSKHVLLSVLKKDPNSFFYHQSALEPNPDGASLSLLESKY